MERKKEERNGNGVLCFTQKRHGVYVFFPYFVMLLLLVLCHFQISNGTLLIPKKQLPKLIGYIQLGTLPMFLKEIVISNLWFLLSFFSCCLCQDHHFLSFIVQNIMFLINLICFPSLLQICGNYSLCYGSLSIIFFFNLYFYLPNPWISFCFSLYMSND